MAGGGGGGAEENRPPSPVGRRGGGGGGGREAAPQIEDDGRDDEIGRYFAVGAASQWQLGAILAHACAGGVKCMFELHETLGGHEAQTLLNVGAHWKLTESLAPTRSA